MFMLPQVIIAFSFLMTIFSFLPRLSAEDIFNPDLGSDFDEDLLTDPFSGDGISNADDLIMASTSPMDNIFDLGRTVDDANPLLGDQETLAAADTGSADISCRAEDNNNPSSLWLTSRLRLRENNNNNFQSELADGKFCVSPAQQGGAAENDENLDLPSFQQLPVVTDIVRPLPEVRQDLCPPWRFGARDIPVCSMANTRFITYQGARMTVVPGAVFCMFSIFLSQP